MIACSTCGYVPADDDAADEHEQTRCGPAEFTPVPDAWELREQAAHAGQLARSAGAVLGMSSDDWADEADRVAEERARRGGQDR